MLNHIQVGDTDPNPRSYSIDPHVDRKMVFYKDDLDEKWYLPLDYDETDDELTATAVKFSNNEADKLSVWPVIREIGYFGLFCLVVYGAIWCLFTNVNPLELL